MTMTKSRSTLLAAREGRGTALCRDAHASNGARASIEAGCTSIEYGMFLDDATLDMMVAHGTYFDPNFLVLHNYLENRTKFLSIGNYNDEGFAYMERDCRWVADV